MGKASMSKKSRQELLRDRLSENPFLTDEELSRLFSVSIQTIRLDRMELGIRELRERIKKVASKSYDKVKALNAREIVGALIDLELGVSGISVLETQDHMTFEKTKIVRGHFIYSLAETLAISVIDADVALVGVANIKYKSPVYSGTHLVAKAVVKRAKSNSFIVWVNIFDKQTEVFRGKFILVALN